MTKFASLLAFLGLLSLASTAMAASTDTNPPASANAGPIKVSAREAKDHIGAEAIVTGKVAEVNQNDRIFRMNFEEPFPNAKFTAVIFSANTNQFKKLDLHSLSGKELEITGKIADYRGHPEIVLNTTNQVKVLDKSAADSKKP